MKKINCTYPYDGYYGYIWGNKKTGRKNINLYKYGSPRMIKSYAKYVYETTHKIMVPSNMHVDHIDDDRTNDSPENLRVITEEENKRKYNRNVNTICMVVLKCPYCQTIFEKPRNKTNHVINKRANFCSKKCSGKFYHIKDEKYKEKMISENVVRTYRRNSQQ